MSVTYIIIIFLSSFFGALTTAYETANMSVGDRQCTLHWPEIVELPGRPGQRDLHHLGAVNPIKCIKSATTSIETASTKCHP